jgi:NAD(P)-dependent dehydrogenase (short-subunit alcohol dehydrogenase family)
MPPDLTDKVIVITGAGSGIGRAAAELAGQLGASVVVAELREQQGKEIAAAIESAGGRSLFVQTDVGSDESLATLFETINSTFGRLDGAFNNAGIGGTELTIDETVPGIFDTIMRVNARGTWMCMHHEVGIMRRQASGAIVNTASVHGLLGLPGNAAYVGSKHAVVGMTRTVALELAAHGVRVNCLCPGATRTELFERSSGGGVGTEEAVASIVPMKRVADARELAAAALWLLSDEASYMTGHALVVDGGFSAQ